MANNPDYANPGGTGDRTASITVTATLSYAGGGAPSVMVDGIKAGATNFYWAGGVAVAGKYLRFDFGAAASKLITEAKYYQQTTTSHGVMKWQGSNNGTDWTDIGGTFTLGGAATQTITTLSGNALGYRYYQMMGVSGNQSNVPWVYEFEFKIDDFVAFKPAWARRCNSLLGAAA